jgi:hypothetical protein
MWSHFLAGARGKCGKSRAFTLNGMRDAVARSMGDYLKAAFQELKRAASGERFLRYHERYQQEEAPLLKALLYFTMVFCLGMSVVLPVVSDSKPLALLFAAVAALLLPGESRWVAMAFDKIEGLIGGRAKRARRTVADPALQSRVEEPLEAADDEQVAAPPAVVQPPAIVQQHVRKPQVSRPVSRPTVRMAVPPIGEAQVPPVRAASPVIISQQRTTPCVRARVVPPRLAGTMKIWSADQTSQPSEAPNVTIVVFPPPVETVIEASEPSVRRRAQ